MKLYVGNLPYNISTPLLFRLIDLVGTLTGQGAGTFAFIALVIGATFTLLGLGLVMAATACALSGPSA